MYCKEITGIHLGENSLEYANLKRTLKGWIRHEPVLYTEISGRTGLERLQSLLANLKPKKTRRICITLPRSRYFLRELSFPGLNQQEAENSVRIAVGMHCHLPKDQIYFDIWPLERNGVTTILLAYVKRSILDPILEILRQTKHGKSLYCISPSGLAADLFLRSSRQVKFPALSFQQEEKTLVLNLHGRREWEGSHLIRTEDETLLPENILALLPENFRGITQAFQLGNMENIPPGVALQDPCTSMEEFKAICGMAGINKGLTACFAGTVSYPQISFQDRPRQRPILLRINTFQWAAALVAIVLLLLTGIRLFNLYNISSLVSSNREIVARLEKQYLPLKQVSDKIEKIKKLEKDIKDFVQEGPPVLEILRELADRTPLDSWIRSCTIRGSVVRVSAEGGSAVETMEAWRKSPLFSNVKLVSPVTKNRKQQERYTVELKLVHLTSKQLPQAKNQNSRNEQPDNE